MATTNTNNVIKMTAGDDAITIPYEIGAIKLHVTAFTSAGAVTIEDAAGNVPLWSEPVTAAGGKPIDPVYINCPQGFNISVTGTFTFILYVYPTR